MDFLNDFEIMADDWEDMARLLEELAEEDEEG